MKRHFAALMLLLTFAAAQNPSPLTRVAAVYVASNYGQWSVKVTAATGALGSQPITVSTGRVTLTDGSTIFPFFANERILVGTETVIVTSTNCGSSAACQIVATFTAPHSPGDSVSSASYGLDEAAQSAANGNGQTGGVVVLDNAWAALGGTTPILTGGTAIETVVLMDNRGTLQQQYCFSGGLYIACGGGGGGSGSITSSGMTVNAVPVATAPQNIENSLITDNGNTLGYTGTGGLLLTSGTGASYVGLVQGASQPTATATVGLTVPTSVTAYNLKFPGAACSTGQLWTFSDGAGTMQCSNASSGSGTVTTSGSPANTYLASFSGPTVVTGTVDGIFSAGALSLGANGTSSGVINLRGSTSGSDSLTPSATAATLTLGGTTAQFALPAGVVGTPILAMGGDATTGLYRPALNKIGFAVSGVEVAAFASGGLSLANNSVINTISQAGNLVVQGGLDSTAGSQGNITTVGGSITGGSTSAAVAGSNFVLGGDNLATGAVETGGDSGRRPGQVTSATPTTAQNGRFNDSVVGIKGTTTTAGHLACVVATGPTAAYPGTYGDCATTTLALNWVGTVRTVTGNSVSVQIAGDALVASNGAASWTAGWTACVDGTNASYVTATSTTACAVGQGVGIVSFTDTSQTLHTIVIHPR